MFIAEHTDAPDDGDLGTDLDTTHKSLDLVGCIIASCLDNITLTVCSAVMCSLVDDPFACSHHN